MKKSTITVLATVGLLVGSAFALQFSDASSKENLLLSRLEGQWLVNMDITQRLDSGRPTLPPKTVEFVKSDKVLDQLRALSPRFKSASVVMGGTMKINETAHPFVIESEQGNSHLVILNPERGDPIGQIVTAFICMAPSRDMTKDLLFLGGDTPRESAAAYDRTGK
jgi:hypothetical protein